MTFEKIFETGRVVVCALLLANIALGAAGLPNLDNLFPLPGHVCEGEHERHPANDPAFTNLSATGEARLWF